MRKSPSLVFTTTSFLFFSSKGKDDGYLVDGGRTVIRFV